MNFRIKHKDTHYHIVEVTDFDGNPVDLTDPVFNFYDKDKTLLETYDLTDAVFTNPSVGKYQLIIDTTSLDFGMYYIELVGEHEGYSRATADTLAVMFIL